MSPRLSRAEQNDRNRSLLLSAALRVFLARGYHAASLELIADEAGFSKGAVYSRFASKADMFLALLTGRIAARAEQNASAVAELTSSGTVAGLIELAWRAERGTPGWRLLVTEFRVSGQRSRAQPAVRRGPRRHCGRRCGHPFSHGQARRHQPGRPGPAG